MKDLLNYEMNTYLFWLEASQQIFCQINIAVCTGKISLSIGLQHKTAEITKPYTFRPLLCKISCGTHNDETLR